MPGTFDVTAVPLDDPRAVALRAELDADLGERYRATSADDGPELLAERRAALAVHPEDVVATLLAVETDGTPIGHLMLRRLGAEWELKRLLVTTAARGRGVARALMGDAIERARAAGAPRVILQTGRQQPESVALYLSLGFAPIPIYEPYGATMPNSLCFELPLAVAGAENPMTA